MKFALCIAIDLGQSIQLYHDQLDHGKNAALGVANADSLATGRKVVQEKKAPEVERLTNEYNRRKRAKGNASRVQNAIFLTMADDIDPNGKVLKSGKRPSKWGSLSKLKRLIGHLK